MLGSTPLVSISDKRLGGIENSSLRYFSAMRALDISMSRIVNPSFSRSVRRLLPAGSMSGLLESVGHHSRERSFFVWISAKIFFVTVCYEIRTYFYPRPD